MSPQERPQRADADLWVKPIGLAKESQSMSVGGSAWQEVVWRWSKSMPVDRKPCVLIVDDDVDVGIALKQMLRRYRLEVHTATSAAEGMEILDVHDIDVVISDENMTGVCGTKFLCIVRDLYPHTIRMLLTGHMSTELAMRAVNDGQVFRLLNKPCPQNELLRALSDGLHKSAEVRTEEQRAEASRNRLAA